MGRGRGEKWAGRTKTERWREGEDKGEDSFRCLETMQGETTITPADIAKKCESMGAVTHSHQHTECAHLH